MLETLVFLFSPLILKKEYIKFLYLFSHCAEYFKPQEILLTDKEKKCKESSS